MFESLGKVFPRRSFHLWTIKDLMCSLRPLARDVAEWDCVCVYVCVRTYLCVPMCIGWYCRVRRVGEKGPSTKALDGPQTLMGWSLVVLVLQRW